MEIQKTEPSEISSVLPVTSTETTESLGQSTPVSQPQGLEAPEQSPHPVINMQTETSLPQDTSTVATENLGQSTLPVVTKTQSTDSLDESTSLPDTSTPTTEILEQSNIPQPTNKKPTDTMEQSVILSEIIDKSNDNVASPKNHQVMVMRQETAEEEEEIRSILKVIAATGKFWHDWEKLRSMLSLHLKQVISEYPQAKMTTEEQKVSLGETYAELVKRLDDALHSFVDGPPFTLQRISEIILDSRSLYPNLSKLALALEKNLSVTSTFTISTDPFPPSLVTTPNGRNKAPNSPNQNVQSDAAMENGGQPISAERDEIMTEADADVSDATTMDIETNEKPSDKVGSSCVPLLQSMVPSKL